MNLLTSNGRRIVTSDGAGIATQIPTADGLAKILLLGQWQGYTIFVKASGSWAQVNQVRQKIGGVWVG